MLGKRDRLVRYDPGEYRERFTFFFWVILVAVCLLVLRLWYLQIIKGEDLLKRSDQALYQAKGQGRNRCVLDPGAHA